MTSTEPLFLSLAWLIVISGAYLLHDGWSSHSWLDKGNAYQAKRLMRRAILAEIVLFLSTATICAFALGVYNSNRMAVIGIVVLVVGSLFNINTNHRLKRKLY